MVLARVPRSRFPLGHALPSTAQGLIHRRHFHATKSQPVWYVAAGAGLTALYLGSRYVLRAQERMRRRREGLPVDDDDDDDDNDHGHYGGARRHRLDRVLGLDFGTANLRLATAEPFSSGASRVIENAEGLRSIPAAVAVENEIVLVGALARALQGRKPGYTATATRLLLGQTPKEIAASDFVKTLPYKIQVDGDAVQLVLDDTRYSPEWAAEVLLDHVHDMAARSLGDEAEHGFPAVIAVPAGASESQRATIERVAVTAGYDLVASVDEPIAAMHAVERVVSDDEATADEFRGAFTGASSGPIAVFDMGGFVSTVSVLERRGATYAVLASQSTTAVSGSLMDTLLFRRVVDRFYQEAGIDLSVDHLASYRILEAVEAAKLELSSRRTTDINLPFITADRTGAKHLVQRLSTFDLSRMLDGPMRLATQLCDATLQQAGLGKDDIGLLVLIGGGVRSEGVQSELEKHFNRRAFASKNFQPEEAVVLGATEFGRRLVVDETE